jgi:hypothetical protein
MSIDCANCQFSILLSTTSSGHTFVSCLSACHARDSGWLYPPCNWLLMSPDMLTLVAAVLAYDRVERASDTWERRSGRSGRSEFR